jgi:hypothetical protein
MPEGGFPIRKSPDQSSFATPRSLSQRTTSFIASQCQGIHRMPLRRLIALIINALHPPPPKGTAGDHTTDKTILLRIHPMPARCTPRDPAPSPPRRDGRNPAHNRMNVLFTMSNNPQPSTTGQRPRRDTAAEPKSDRRRHAARSRQTRMAGKPEWWSQTGSNRRPHACKARALPAELWPQRRRASPKDRPGKESARLANGGPGKT